MMRITVFILLVSGLVVGCNYKKNTDIEPNIAPPVSKARPRRVSSASRTGRRTLTRGATGV